MIKQKQFIPKRRFEEFSDEWKLNSFNELLDKLEGIRRGPFGSALKKEYFVPHSNYVVYEQQNAIYDRYQTRYYITKQKYEELSRFSVNKDDFIMSGAGTIGRISKVPKGIKKGVINQALIRIRVNKKMVDSNYFLQWMRSENMQHKLTQENPASAMVNLVPMSEIKGWQIKVPSIKEQQKIGQFFKHLDEMIALQQRKIDKIKALKSAYLTEMFPAEGERVPKRRFTEFEGEWRKIRIGDLYSSIESGNRLPKTMLVEGPIPYVIAKTTDNGILMRIDYKTSDYHGNKMKKFPSGSITLSIDNPEAIFLQKEPFYTSNIMRVLYMEEYNDNQSIFILESLKNLTKNYNWALKFSGPVVMNSLISMPVSSNRKVNWIEVDRLGQVINNLNDLAILYEQKLEKLKATKQAYLHEMFV